MKRLGRFGTIGGIVANLALPEARDGVPPSPEPEDISDPEWQRAFFERMRARNLEIPARFRDKTLDGFEPRNARCQALRGAALRYAAHFPESIKGKNGIFMVGGTGVGKSHLASGIAGLVARDGHSVEWFSVPSLLRRIRSTFDRNAEETETEILREVCAPDLLVLDELGAEKPTEFVLERLYLIFNQRYEDCRAMIVTSNYSLPDLESRVGPRIVSRIHEMCHVLHQFPVEDQRRIEP